jgi:hypothetical protein
MDSVDVDKVTDVLLADGWHKVENESFMIGGYGFLWHGPGGDGPPRSLRSADVEAMCPIGFEFEEFVERSEADPKWALVRKVSGPLTAILAVRSLASPG